MGDAWLYFRVLAGVAGWIVVIAALALAWEWLDDRRWRRRDRRRR